MADTQATPVPLNDNNLLAEDVLDYLTQSNKAGLAISANNKEASQQASEVSKLYESVGANLKLIKQQEGLATLKTQQANLKAAQAAGAVPGAAGNVLNNLISQVTSVIPELNQNLAKVRQEQTIKFEDNPIEFLKNHLFYTDAERALKQNTTQLSVLDSQIGIVNKALQETARTNAALSEPITQATIDATAENAAAAAMVQARQAKIESLKYDSASVKELADLSKDRINAIMQYRGAVNTEENQALQREQFAALQEERAARLDLIRQGKADKAAAQQIDDQTLSYINQSKAALGQPLMTAEEFKFQNQLYKQGKNPEFSYHLDNGMRIAMTGKSSISQTPYDSITVLRTIPSNIPEIRKETARLIADAERTVLNDPKIDKKNKQQVADTTNELVQQAINQQYSTITKESVFNVGDLSNYLGRPGDPGVRDLFSLPISQKLLLPAIAANQPLDDAKVIMNLIVSGVETGKITSTEALGISDIFRKASLMNQEARGFHAFGITVPEGGVKYNVSLGGFLSKNIVNLNDPVAVARYLSSALAAKTYNLPEVSSQFP